MQTNAQQTAPASGEGFLDEKQILARLPVSRRTLFNWRASGKIPSIKIGRRCLYHGPSVDAALLRLQRGGVS
jgi:hypothetical protein